MSLFKEAVNQQAFLKAGILGFAGSGKTTTGMYIAKGISERLGKKRPVMFLDTEAGSDYFVTRFKEYGIPLHVAKTRAFSDLLDAVREAEKGADVLVIDSISAFWKEIMSAYMKANNRKRLTFADWNPIKENWARFTDAYLNSRVHIIMNGRASYEYDFFTDEAGAKQLEKTGTKMSAEGNMSYEPGLLIEMIREPIENPDKTPEARRWNNVAVVLKDRTDRLNGKRFINPTFEAFAPVFDFLNIGGEHIGINADRDSTKLFEKDSDDNWQERKKMVEITLEEIQGEITSAIPGQSAEDKKAKADILHETFGTRSWTAISDMRLEDLKKGLTTVREWAKTRNKEAVSVNGKKED